MSDFFSIPIPADLDFKSKLVHWAQQFPTFSFLDSNGIADPYSTFDFILAVDTFATYHKLDDLVLGKFYFGYLAYHFEKDTPRQKPFIDFGDSLFFEPRYILFARNHRLYFNRNATESLAILDSILDIKIKDYTIPKLKLAARVGKSEYINQIQKIQNKILEGKFYELNYCVEFYNEEASLDPISTFLQINSIAKAPMSALIKHQSKYALCFSPERLARLSGTTLTSQPIKGTARRDIVNMENDERIKAELEFSQKERAENIMIVDLVRHDMTPYAHTGSIQVEELCKIYTFPFVHQMISTISAELRDKSYAKDALRALLPAGSMTGAPKKEVMKTIQVIENFERGLYAGNIGYFAPDGDFDFNVVIRTLYYDESASRLSLAVGGAITLLSSPETEYHECLLKAEGILKFFQ